LPKSSLPLKLGICLHSHVPEFIEFKNSLPKSQDLNSLNYSVWGHCNRWHGHKISVTDQLKRVLIECWAQLILNTLTPAIDQLPRRTDDGYECKNWATAYVEFHLNSTYVLMIVDISLYAEWKLTLVHALLPIYHDFRGGAKLSFIFLQHSKTFDITHKSFYH